MLIQTFDGREGDALTKKWLINKIQKHLANPIDIIEIYKEVMITNTATHLEDVGLFIKFKKDGAIKEVHQDLPSRFGLSEINSMATFFDVLAKKIEKACNDN